MEPFVGYITLVGFNFAPQGWAFCNGQLLSISDNIQLFTLIGTTYGGDGQTTFALPDLRGRAPIHYGQGTGLSPYAMGQQAGAELVTLNANQIPAHSHQPLCGGAGTASGPVNAIWGGSTNNDMIYKSGTPAAAMAGTPFTGGGGGQPHENRQPYLALNYIIALDGIFPSQN